MIIDINEARRDKYATRLNELTNIKRNYCSTNETINRDIEEARERLIDCQDNTMTCGQHIGELSFLNAGMESDSSPNYEGGGIVSPHTQNPVLTQSQHPFYYGFYHLIKSRVKRCKTLIRRAMSRQVKI
jgi:hypothetical protein